ncbi:MAG: hypothetical protein BWY02_02908 [bacterium ADurb.Bin157]|nr:MAG: hypothetical protein BWY02_02908 [bacterium ADurb.Bin157]
MVLEDGYIKLHRSITKWEWYTDANTARLFIHLLLTVNHFPQKWQGIVIERGQRVTSYKELSNELRLSERSVRTAINHLKSTHELTLSTTSKYGLYTINNYEKYQEATLKLTPERHPSDTQATPDRQQSKKDKKDKKDKKESTAHFDAFWSAYPRKVGKGVAFKSFEKIKVDEALLNQMLKAISEQVKSEQWRKESGRYIPNPSTWLNQERWNDEVYFAYDDCPI